MSDFNTSEPISADEFESIFSIFMEHFASPTSEELRQRDYLRRNPRRSSAVQYVYFIEGAGKVKIGITADVHIRLKELQSASPVQLNLLACFPGTPENEAMIHQKFSNLRSHGEWFYDCDAIRRVIAILSEMFT